MRTLFVMTDALIGGAERLVAMLGAHWPDGEHRGLVVLMGSGSLSEPLEAAFDHVHYLNFSPSSLNLLGMVRALERVIAQEEPDVISSHMFHADLVTALARTRVPKTSTAHTHGLTKADHPLTRAIARLVGLLSGRFRAVVPSSSSDDMAEFLRTIRMRNVVAAIPNGAPLPETPVFSSDARAFVSIGRNHAVKGHQVLLAAFAQVAEEIPEWTLRLIGPGVTPEELAIEDSRAQNLAEGGRITLEGPTDRPDRILENAAALVISSLYGETLPLVGIEAAGAGVPVITTRVGSCPEFADDPRFVVEPGDVGGLADALLLYAGLHDDERSQLSRLARARAESDYSPDVIVSKYHSLYFSIMEDQVRG